MDVGAARHYVTRAMSFLLVLSAVFNALTGAFVGARPAEPVPQQQVAIVAEVAEQQSVPAAPVAKPIPVEPAIAETPAPAPAPALATERLLE
jgi:hypothetical protein